MSQLLDLTNSSEQLGIIPGPLGPLVAAYSPSPQLPTDLSAPFPLAVICHPHPLHGGTMDNKVVTTLARFYRDNNLATIRFNFRGVNGSAGQYGEGEGEVADLIAVVQWVTQQLQRVPRTLQLHLAGFSFGSYIAARGANELPCLGLISIAPPVHHFAFDKLSPITCPWLVVQGEQDEVVDPEEVYRWHAHCADSPLLLRLPETGHYFHGKLLNLRTLLQTNYHP